MWGFEQKIGLLYVHVPIRMTAVRLESGGLLLYGAVAPTGECLELHGCHILPFQPIL